MNIKGFRNSLMALGLIAAFAIAGTGCSNKLYSDPDMTSASAQTTIDPMSFAAIDARIREYNFGINEYMREHQAEAVQKKTQGATPGGVAADCTYTVSPDGKYESLQMEKRLADGMQVDEYFNLGDAVFAARTTIYDDGNFDPVDKYYIIDGGLYKIDGSAETVTKLTDINGESGTAKKAELDLYYSFDEIRAIYG